MKLRRGLLVRDVNDRTVGVVTAVTDSSFAVRVADSQFWLLADALFYVAEHAAKLICSKEDIRRYEANALSSDDAMAGGGGGAGGA